MENGVPTVRLWDSKLDSHETLADIETATCYYTSTYGDISQLKSQISQRVRDVEKRIPNIRDVVFFASEPTEEYAAAGLPIPDIEAISKDPILMGKLY